MNSSTRRKIQTDAPPGRKVKESQGIQPTSPNQNERSREAVVVRAFPPRGFAVDVAESVT